MMLLKKHSFRFFFIGICILFSFSVQLNASVSLNDYPQIKSHWDDGELTIAIDQLQEEAKKGPEKSATVELIKKLTFQKKKFDQWLAKANDLLKQQKFEESMQMISFIKEINPNYVRYRELMSKIKTTEEEFKYPSRVIFNRESFGKQWKPCEVDGKFSNYAKFENDTLLVDYPQNYGWGRIGIESNDTVVNFDENVSPNSSTLTFKFDPKETTGFEINLEGVNRKSQSYSKIVIRYRHIDENASILELHKDGELQAKLDMGKEPAKSLKLTILPNNFAYLTLPDGKYLQTTSLKYPVPEKGYTLKVHARASHYKAATKMALKSIEQRDIPLHKKKEEMVLFDGKYLFGRWEPYAKNGGNFIEHARFEKNELIVDVPEGHGWGQVGIWSTEPIIDFMETNQSLSYHLKFNFDNKNTKSFSIMIAGLVHLDYKRKNGKKSTIELWNTSFLYGGHMYSKLDLGSDTPEYVEIVMQPHNIMQIKLPDGRSMQVDLPNSMTTKKHKIGIYSVAKEKNSVAKMTLQSIVLKKLPFVSSHLSNLKENEKKIVLFTANLGDIWLPYSGNGGDYSKFSYFNEHELIVDVPKDNKWGESGIVSSKSPIWLDKLGKDGNVSIKVNFNPSKTTGFSLIAGDINKNGNVPWGEYIQVHWIRDRENNISKLQFKIKDKLLIDENITEITPSTVTLSFKKGEVGIEGDTFKKKIVKWSHVVEDRPLYLWVVSRAAKYNQPTKMALKKITLERVADKPLSAAKPAKGVAPLPIKEIYGNGVHSKWKCFAANMKESNCTLSSSNLVITVPEDGESLIGIRSKNQIITLDERRIKETPLKITLYFDPKKTDSFYIGLDKYYVTLEKKSKKTYLFKWGDKWGREVDAKWLKNEWNGQVNIVMSKSWTKVGLDKGTMIHTDDRMSRSPLLSILAAAPKTKMKYGGILKLEKITTKWITPDGMTATDRWNLIDDEDFDPDEFLREIKEGR